MTDFFRFLHRHRWTIGVAAAAGLLVGLILALTLPKVYRAEAKMLPADTRGVDVEGGLLGQLGGLAGLAGLDMNLGTSSKAAALEVLRSRALAREFILERGLVDALLKREPSGTAEPPNQKDINAAVRRFDEKVRRVTEDRRSGIIVLAIEWRDPQIAADWANALVAQLNRKMRDRAGENARRSLKYLNLQLQQNNTVEIRQSIFRLMEHELKASMLAEVSEEYALRVVDPAIAPDPRKQVRPRPVLYALGGLALALLFALVIGVYRDTARVTR